MIGEIVIYDLIVSFFDLKESPGSFVRDYICRGKDNQMDTPKLDEVVGPHGARSCLLYEL